MDRKIVVASIALFCSALILGAVIYNAASIQNASPYPQDAVTPQLPESPVTSSTPTESSLLNSKTLTVPDDYPTITEAIGNASTGDTVFVKKGTYEGITNQTLLINKTISLLGENASNTKISLHPPLVPYTIFTQTFLGYDNSIRIEANGVKLAGFTIMSDGGGISATGNATEISGNIMSMGVTAVGDRMKIIGNIMASVNLRGCNQTIAQNTISGGIGEFLVYYAGENSTIASNNVTGSVGGISIIGFHNAIYGNFITAESGINGGLELNGERNMVAKNYITNFVSMEGSFNILCGNTIPNNLAIVGNNNIFYANYMQGLIIGNRVQDASNNTFYHNNFDFIENPVLPAGEKTFRVMSGIRGLDFLDNGKEGNYWSDYNGTDANGNGIGDTPYVINAKDPRNYHWTADFDIANIILTDHYPLMMPFDISTVTVKMPEWATPGTLLFKSTSQSPSSSILPSLSQPDSSPTPSSSPNYSPSPIQAAINSANPGSTIHVPAGHYYGHVDVNKTLNLVGEGSASTIFDGNCSGNVIDVTADNVEISGFTIQNSGLREIGINVKSCKGFNIHDSVIKNNHQGLVIVSCSNTLISENRFTLNANFGALINYSSSVTFSRNIITKNKCQGLVVFRCLNCTVSENQIVDNDDKSVVWTVGMVLSNSQGVTVSDNNMTGNADNGLSLVNSHGNSIFGNNISRNDNGISLSTSTNNNIYLNYVQANKRSIQCYGSSNNRIYHNYFINNTNQIYNFFGNERNEWDNGYPSGGNYWSDYASRYPNATEIDGSGIGDAAYIIDANNKDSYPLMKTINQ